MSQKVVSWLGTSFAVLITRKFGSCTVAEVLTGTTCSLLLVLVPFSLCVPCMSAINTVWRCKSRQPVPVTSAPFSLTRDQIWEKVY